MHESAEALRLILAAILAVASVAKLADRAGAREAMRSFGAPAALAGPLAVLVPVLEAAIAVALLPASVARYGATAAAALFAAFALVVAVARLRGRTPDCHCFGRLHSAPAGWPVVARNLALALAAAVVVSRPATGIGVVEVAAVGVGGLIVGQAILSYTLLRRYGRALRRIEELEAADGQAAKLEVGAEAPAFGLPSLDGGQITLAGLLSPARPVLLVFADPDCGPCHALMPKVAHWQRSLAEQLTVAVVSRGDHEDNIALAREHELSNVFLQDGREISGLYDTWATPSAVLVGADGRIQRAPVAGGEAIERVVEALTPAAAQTPEQPARAHRELAAAAAVAGGIAATAAAAQASPGVQRQQPPNPELQAIEAALKAAGPRLMAASRRSLKAVRAQATLKGGNTLRAKRAAARKALAAERRQVLALRATVAKLAETSREAHNVKVILDNGLSLLAQSLTKREQAISANPEAALRLLAEGQDLLLQSVGSGAAAGKLLRRGR